MPFNPEEISIRRITVALDCSPHSRASLEAAAVIAGALHAELSGIFVEDINLIRVAELPFSEEIHLHTARSEHLDPERVMRLLRLQSRQALALLTETAERFGIPHSFRTIRGPVPAEIIAAALEGDLLALGRTGRTLTCRKGLGTTAKQAVREAKTHLLIAHSGFQPARPLLVLYDRSKAARLALRTSAGIAGGRGALHVLLLAGNEREAKTMREEAESVAAGAKRGIEFHVIPWTDSEMLSQCIRMIGPGLLVLGDEMEAIGKETVHRLIDRLAYPVLLVKTPA